MGEELNLVRAPVAQVVADPAAQNPPADAEGRGRGRRGRAGAKGGRQDQQAQAGAQAQQGPPRPAQKKQRSIASVASLARGAPLLALETERSALKSSLLGLIVAREADEHRTETALARRLEHRRHNEHLLSTFGGYRPERVLPSGELRNTDWCSKALLDVCGERVWSADAAERAPCIVVFCATAHDSESASASDSDLRACHL
eukprot:7688607-Alexandrium_andersonii.AAC.1